MKRITLFLLPALFLTATSSAQPLGLLTNMHPRPKTSFFRSSGETFHLVATTKIVISDNASQGTLRAVQYLNRGIREQLGDTLLVVHYLQQFGDSNAIMIGEVDNFGALAQRMSVISPLGEHLPGAEGYALDISQARVLLAGRDTSGTFYSVSTFAQLLNGSNGNIPALHLTDWPDYPVRLVFSQHNLQVPANCAVIAAIEDTMAAHKLNGLQQNDFKNNILGIVPSWYFTDVDSIHRHSWETNVELIPGVCDIGYSEGVLFHDPDLAEGIYTTAIYTIEGDTGRIVSDPRTVLPNGGFENVANGQFTGWSFYDGPDKSAFVDSTTVHSGRYSARCEHFTDGNPSGNCRFNRLLTCHQQRAYHLSVWIKTQGFRGTFQLLAIGLDGSSTTQPLTFTQYSVPQTTSGWQQYHVVFHTLDKWQQVYVYCGVWGGTAGTIWFDDFQIEEAGLTNGLRRPSQMPHVISPTPPYVEGVDYEPIVDSVMEKSFGSYPWHPAPTFKIRKNGHLHNGDTIEISYIQPNPVLNDRDGSGSTMVCVSEDTLYSILHDQIARVDALHHPNRYFMSHDEIRVMNWDEACTKRQRTPAELLADNLTKCDSIVERVHPNADRFVWSDMFDSLHNAHSNYYLVNGDLSGDWDLIPKNITIVNWNGQYLDTSLDFFARHGFRQITSPYYDEQDTRNIREWRKAMNRSPQGVRGMMYTTWSSDYSYLTPFADYAWSAGPMIVHRPIDSSDLARGQKTFEVDVYPDPYDKSDSIVSVIVVASNGWDVLCMDTLQRTTGNHYSAPIHCNYQYHFEAVNKQGIRRITPSYVTGSLVQGVPVGNYAKTLKLYPNPARENVTVEFPDDREYRMEVVNLLGSAVRSLAGRGISATVDVQSLPPGTYVLRVTNSAENFERPFVIIR